MQHNFNSEGIRNIQLTPEDIDGMQRCRKEAFRYRCLPLMVLGNAAVYALKQRGKFANKSWVMVPAVLSTTFSMWLLGHISYRDNCKRIIMDLNDSRLKDMLLNKLDDSSLSGPLRLDDLPRMPPPAAGGSAAQPSSPKDQPGDINLDNYRPPFDNQPKAPFFDYQPPRNDFFDDEYKRRQ